jgi:hypothetical protein
MLNLQGLHSLCTGDRCDGEEAIDGACSVVSLGCDRNPRVFLTRRLLLYRSFQSSHRESAVALFANSRDHLPEG